MLECCLSKHNNYALFGILKQFFSCFYHSIFDATVCYLLESLIHALREQVKYCLFQLFLQCFEIFVEQTKEIMYRKWNTAFLADLIWTCGQYVLFRNIFVSVSILSCAQIIKILNFLLIN